MVKERKELSLAKLSATLKNPPQDVYVSVYTKKQVEVKPVKKPSSNKFTLAMLAEKIDNLGNDLRNEMNAGFKQVNARIDRLDTRLDYIVKANNLKDLPNRK